MNQLIHLWRGQLDYAVLKVYGNPAPFYFGPIIYIPGAPLGMSKEMTHHLSLTEARGAAAMRGFDVLQPDPATLLLVTQRLAALRSDAGFSDAVSYLPELASVVEHAEAILAGRPFEVTP